MLLFAGILVLWIIAMIALAMTPHDDLKSLAKIKPKVKEDIERSKRGDR